jgi:hypothetical protein
MLLVLYLPSGWADSIGGCCGCQSILQDVKVGPEQTEITADPLDRLV